MTKDNVVPFQTAKVYDFEQAKKDLRSGNPAEETRCDEDPEVIWVRKVVLDGKPKLYGTAVCRSCKHSWTHTADRDEALFDCPECQREAGIWRTMIYVAPGMNRAICNNCDGDLFSAYADRHLMCAMCGEVKDMNCPSEGFTPPPKP